MRNSVLIALSITALIVLPLLSLAPLYDCMGIYCADDGTSFYTFDYSVVADYNEEISK